MIILLAVLTPVETSPGRRAKAKEVVEEQQDDQRNFDETVWDFRDEAYKLAVKVRHPLPAFLRGSVSISHTIHSLVEYSTNALPRSSRTVRNACGISIGAPSAYTAFSRSSTPKPKCLLNP